MIARIPQRTQDDCAICTVAMVMGPPYGYERALADSHKYSKISPDEKFPAWWETYLRDEGFYTFDCHLAGLRALPDYNGSVTAILGMKIPHLKMVHVVAVDELGVVDPADNAPDHIKLQEYVSRRCAQGVVFDEEFLAVTKLAGRRTSEENYATRVSFPAG